MEVGGAHEVPPLAEELLLADSFFKTENWFPLHPNWFPTTSQWMTPCQIVQRQDPVGYQKKKRVHKFVAWLGSRGWIWGELSGRMGVWIYMTKLHWIHIWNSQNIYNKEIFFKPWVAQWLKLKKNLLLKLGNFVINNVQMSLGTTHEKFIPM